MSQNNMKADSLKYEWHDNRLNQVYFLTRIYEIDIFSFSFDWRRRTAEQIGAWFRRESYVKYLQLQ